MNPKDRYAEYLKTDYWNAVTTAVKAKAQYRCQVCNSPHDLQAHHRSYEHRGKELEHLEDMTCLCRRCHSIFHGALQTSDIKEKPPVKYVLITRENYKRLKCTKEPWHWMRVEGINPKKKGWAERAIGKTVPEHFLY